ncbi:MAG: hypothetical protein LBT81_04705 [Helicobacteraceae bacterium]|nr:hypothetical protein [Helicobacteraceae bacterium]
MPIAAYRIVFNSSDPFRLARNKSFLFHLRGFRQNYRAVLFPQQKRRNIQECIFSDPFRE